MRSLLATRSARLVLAAVAAATLTATVTACDPTTGATDAASPAGASTTASAPASAPASAAASAPASGGTSASPAAPGAGTGSGGSSDPTIDVDAAKQNYYAKNCDTSDVTFTVSSQSQAGGYFLVTAKAKPGVICYLEGKIPDASFGSAADTVASNTEQAVTDSIKLSGSTAAYAGINPKSTNTDYGVEFGQLIVAVLGSDGDPVELKLPQTTLVDKPVTTNWHASRADAVPFTS
ncbi:hypothetical protein ACFO3J_30255 [Streptomyces polygonati]|uniref:DUF4232 domain-containing protein n=1 Tax=Streptomyces polygonati TaxID=1617087 RepID=A0ABV8HUN7_9ACTN